VEIPGAVTLASDAREGIGDRHRDGTHPRAPVSSQRPVCAVGVLRGAGPDALSSARGVWPEAAGEDEPYSCCRCINAFAISPKRCSGTKLISVASRFSNSEVSTAPFRKNIVSR
jgi:hypothetical protein